MSVSNQSTLTDSSEDESSDTGEPSPKRPRTVVPSPGFGSDSQALSSDRGSTDQSDFSCQLSDDDNRMPKMVKEVVPKSCVNPYAQKIMESMGYRSGEGLGKYGQGRVDPVEMSQQLGRRGLGSHIPGLEAANLEWDSSQETVLIEEKVQWLAENMHEPISQRELFSWIKEGPCKRTIDDETHFCDPNLLQKVLTSKTIFDNLQPEEMRKARTRSNPFETIRGAIFLNRAAVKMANMDSVFDFMFTDPKNQAGAPMVGPHDLLYFADVCAGPGGFSEYVLWKRKWHAKGFGFTLKAENDFRLSDFYAGPCETFEPHYGVGGLDGDGDVCNPENISCFKKFVLNQTNTGVHFMMADGGFSVANQENIQEILSKQLYLCQFLVALCIVRTGGNFVCKLFDLFTPFSVGLVYLMYKSFDQICIHKPNSSRPANSERYIICKWKRNDCDDIVEYMFHIARRLWTNCSSPDASNSDIVEVVPLSILKDDEMFFNYIVKSNNSLAERQVVNLAKIAAFCRDVTLIEQKQSEIRRACMKYWGIPDRARTAPPQVSPNIKFEELVNSVIATSSFLPSEKESLLTPEALGNVFKSIYDWHCVVLSRSQDKKSSTFFLSLGRNRVFRWESGRSWVKVENANLELSPDTLVYGELMQELHGEGKSQRKISSFHIIDGFILGGMYIYKEHLTKRRQLCCTFANALYKPSRTDLTRVRVKELYDLEEVKNLFQRLDLRVVKGHRQPGLVYVLPDEDDRFFIPGGLLFLRATQSPWMRHISQKTGFKYYASHVNSAIYDKHRPEEACANFTSSIQSRYVWWWEEGVCVHNSHSVKDPAKLQKDDLLAFVNSKIKRV